MLLYEVGDMEDRAYHQIESRRMGIKTELARANRRLTESHPHFRLGLDQYSSSEVRPVNRFYCAKKNPEQSPRSGSDLFHEL